jgi:hypothetical protein
MEPQVVMGLLAVLQAALKMMTLQPVDAYLVVLAVQEIVEIVVVVAVMAFVLKAVAQLVLNHVAECALVRVSLQATFTVLMQMADPVA